MILALGDGTTDNWTNYIQTGGVVGVLSLLVAGILREWLVPGWTYRAMVKDRDYYRDIAHRSITLADRQTTVAEVLTDHLVTADRREERLQAKADAMRRDERDP